MSVNWTKTKQTVSTLESKLKCFVCEKLPVNPQLLWCKHSFCELCITTRQVCPKCQFPVSPQEMVPDIILNKLLQAMRVAVQVSKCNQEFDNKEQTVSTHKSQKDFKAPKNTVKNMDGKGSHSVKYSRRKSCESKDIGLLVVEKQGDHTKTDEVRTRALRRSSRSSSPQRENQTRPEVLRRSSRGNSPQTGQKKITEKNKPITMSRNMSPKPSIKKNDIMLTPKHKLSSKSTTPIVFSAKKVQHTKVNSKGETPLQIACRQGKLSLVQQLLREGAEPNVKDYANWTPLCDAVGSGNLEVVRTLLEAGAAVNTPANLNTTALVEAVMRKNKAMAELLMNHGADMNQRTALNNTALSLADDEIKAVMLSCDHVIIQPPPRVPTTPRAVFVDTQLPPPQLDQVMEFCRQFNLTLSTEFTEDITHIVVEKSAANTCKASRAVMLAILSGCSVVGVDWVMSSLETGKLVAVDEFEACGTTDYPTSDVFHKARRNKEQLLPRLFDGCHISLQHDQPWTKQLKLDTVSLITYAGAQYQPRQCDPERVPQGEHTVMYHTAPAGPLGALSHIILYQTNAPAHEPLLKYNMAHVKSLSLSWFYKCIQTFNITLD